MNQQTNTKNYEYWRTRILYSTMLGYVFFYFIRKNLSMAMPVIEADLGINKIQLGTFLTLHTLIYGISRFANGILADKINPRYFMAAGLLLCAVANFGFGMSTSATMMGVFWIVNGWFQGMGFPPCAKSLSHWFAAEERGVKFSIWNTSHSIGAGLVILLNTSLIYMTGDWRYCFIVPAFIGLLGAYFLWERLRDTPESMGLMPVEEYYLHKHGLRINKAHENGLAANEELEEKITEEVEKEIAEVMAHESWGQTLLKHVFLNPAVWVIAFANFFVYLVRFSFLDWAPTFLLEEKGLELTKAGIISSAFELIGVFGMLASGFLMDRVFRGRGAKVCFFYMLGCTVTIFLFWNTQSTSVVINAVLIGLVGFFTYGPQCLIGVIAANIATKKAAAAANGVTGIMGYASGIVTGRVIGQIVESNGWNPVFIMLIVASFIGMLLFIFAWNAVSPEQLAAEKIEREKIEQ